MPMFGPGIASGINAIVNNLDMTSEYSGKIASAADDTHITVDTIVKLEDSSTPADFSGRDYPSGTYAIRITGGKGDGQIRQIDSFDGKTLTLKSALYELPDATSTYILGSVESAYSAIRQNATNINLKVDKANVVSQINLNPEGIKLNGALIKLDGDVLIDSKFSLTAGLIKSADGKTIFDLNKSYIITTHPDNADIKIKFFGRGMYVSSDGGVSWQNAIVYDEASGKVGLDVSLGIMGKLATPLLDLTHIYAYNEAEITDQSDNNTEYSTTNKDAFVEQGSTGEITVATGQTNTEIYFSAKGADSYSQAPQIKIQICDTVGNVKKEWIKTITSASYQYWNETVDITTWFAEGEKFVVKRFIKAGV